VSGDEPPDVGSCHLDGDVHSHLFMTVDGAIELIGAFLKETVRSPVLPGARVGVALSFTPAPSTVRLWANLPLLVTLKV
jgi:hypothetical protein